MTEPLICPECGAELETVHHEVTGIETYQHVCTECDYRSEPE